MGASRPDCAGPSRTQIKFCMHVSPQIGRAIGTTPRSMIASSLVICQSCRNPQPVDSLDAGDDDSSTPKRLESEHRSCDSLDRTVVLLDDVVEVLVLAHQDVDTGVSLDAFNGGRVGATFVNRDLFGQVMQIDG